MTVTPGYRQVWFVTSDPPLMMILRDPMTVEGIRDTSLQCSRAGTGTAVSGTGEQVSTLVQHRTATHTGVS